MPAARSSRSLATLASALPITWLSVISSSIGAARRSASPMAPSTVATKSRWRSCTGDTFTAIGGTATPAAAHAAASRRACSMIQRPTTTMRPVSSSIGTKTSGAMSSPSLVRQRISTSMPTMDSLASSTLG